ncbi:MAG: hypothetical protein O2944_10900 [Proteobacteria bacterium]|nr:hypothetical protein [Pseudomonadota bacterium]
MNAEIIWTPLLPPIAVTAIAGVGILLLLVQTFRAGRRGLVARALLIGLLSVALLEPRLSIEERTAQNDIALIVTDETSSQKVRDRALKTAAAADQLAARLAALPGMDVRTVAIGDATGGGAGSKIVGAITDALAEVPRQRFAGTIVITDGQIHDAETASADLPGPVHFLITGKSGEKDRRLVVVEAPGYGIVGKEISIRYRVEDAEAKGDAEFGSNLVDVTIRVDGREAEKAKIPLGKEVIFDLVLDHAGPNLIEIEAAPGADELTAVNNRAVLAVNGVRDRLRVLLVSGQPHAGERAWRNLLKSDPSVDLVHFTILRPPEKNDFTPLNEISLIAFPVRELFEEKIADFDLIVFDRYMVRDVLPPQYFRNIAAYVRNGGAVLLAVGPEFGGLRSLARTPLNDILPATPTGKIVEERFKPNISDLGHRHPVTAALPGAVVPGRNDLEPTWGAWFRQIELQPSTGATVMTGAGGRPLLVLERVDKGRVALFASDHLWLWSRGYDDGGPQAELTRRLAHWLMREPELEEEGLFASVDGGDVVIERRSLAAEAGTVTVTSPSGEVRRVELSPGPSGRSIARIAADEVGLYRIEDGPHIAFAAAGALNPLELADLRADTKAAAQISGRSGGSVRWLADGLPEIRGVQPARQLDGKGWIGMVRNEAYAVTGVTSVPLLPWWLVLTFGIGLAALAWWREGR